MHLPAMGHLSNPIIAGIIEMLPIYLFPVKVARGKDKVARD